MAATDDTASGAGAAAASTPATATDASSPAAAWTPPQFPHTTTMFSYFIGDRLTGGQGDNVALIDGRDGSTTTYAQLAERAYRAGNVLRSRGVEIEQRVLIVQNNCPELMWAYWGCHAIGAVTTMCVPYLTNPDLYKHFLSYTRAKAAVVPATLVDAIKPMLPDLPYLKAVLVTGASGEAATLEAPFFDFAAEMEAAPATLELPRDLCKDDVALWYFTGGTTGLPKGCVHLQHDMPYAAETYGKITMQLTQSDITATVSPMVGPYAMGSNCLFPFAVGAAVVLDNAQPSTAASVFDLVATHKPTVLSSTPGIIRSMAEDERAGSKTDLASLRYITSAGDVLPAAVYRRWKDATGVEILDGIGTSELQHIFLSNTLEPGGVKPGSVGKAVPGYQVSLVDDSGHEVARGDVGEMRIRADSNSVAYFNKHEQSKEVFAGDWYTTGDMAFEDEDGYFRLCGRKKDLKSMFSDKRRDMRVSFLRVEDELLCHAAVADCAIVDVLPEEGDPVNTAYVVLHKTHALADAGADDAAARDALAKELLEHLTTAVGSVNCPAQVRFVGRIPRNARDKIERKLLRDALYTLFCQRDTDSSGFIEFAEFMAFATEQHIVPAGDDAAAAAMFARFDKDKTERLTFGEFRAMLRELGVHA